MKFSHSVSFLLGFTGIVIGVVFQYLYVQNGPPLNPNLSPHVYDGTLTVLGAVFMAYAFTGIK